MSLVYLITGLPRLSLNHAPPINREQFKARALANMGRGSGLRDLNLLLLLEDVEAATGRANAEQLGLHPPEDAKPMGRKLPTWLSEDRPHHVLSRLWRRRLYQYASSHFLKNWSRESLNLEELIAALLCRAEGMTQTDFLIQMEGGFDSTWKMSISHYEDPDMGLSKRLNYYQYVAEALRMEDFEAMERRLDSLRWRMIEACLGLETFSNDVVLAYYLKLRILERRFGRSEERGREIMESLLQWDEGTVV